MQIGFFAMHLFLKSSSDTVKFEMLLLVNRNNYMINYYYYIVIGSCIKDKWNEKSFVCVENCC